MDDRRPVRGFLGPFAIEVSVEDGFDGREGTGADGQRPLTGRFQPLAAAAPGELDDAATGSEALLGVWPLTQDNLNEGGGMRADCAGLCLMRSSVQSP